LVERHTWTDERIDDLSRRVDAGFERVDKDMRDLRTDMNSGFAEVRTEISSLKLTVMRFGGGLLIAQFGLIAALIARG
jgi:hypothetical protein